MKAIYIITNTLTGACYVGSAINVRDRLTEHRTGLRRGCWEGRTNSYLQNSWNVHGEDCFRFEILEELPDCATEDDLLIIEQEWLDFLWPTGYNTSPIAGRPPRFDELTSEKQEEVRQKISSKTRGRVVSDEVREVYRRTSTGRKHSEETKEKIRQYNRTRLRKKGLLGG